jgi:anti-sigma factor RsiW
MNEQNVTTPERSSCEETARQLYDYLDRQLSAMSDADVIAHLVACGNCARHFKFARDVMARIPQALADESVSPALRERILATLRAEGYSG